MSRDTWAAVAPPRFTTKFACCSETWAAPSRAPFRPAASTRRPAESPGGVFKTLPPFSRPVSRAELDQSPGDQAPPQVALPQRRGSVAEAQLLSGPDLPPPPG